MEDKDKSSNLSENIKPQVSGMTTEKEKNEPTSQLKNQELFYRSNQYRGS